MSASYGLLGRNISPVQLKRTAWCSDALQGLAHTFYGHEERVAACVRSGDMLLYRVSDAGWLVLQHFKKERMLFVWCYEGSGLLSLIGDLRKVAQMNDCDTLSFFTRHKAALRALRRFKPWASPTRIDNEVQYFIDCKGALDVMQ